MIIFVKEGRAPQMLLKVTADIGDDHWVVTDGVYLTTGSPTKKEIAERYLTPKNGWTRHEVNGPRFDLQDVFPYPKEGYLEHDKKVLLEKCKRLEKENALLREQTRVLDLM